MINHPLETCYVADYSGELQQKDRDLIKTALGLMLATGHGTDFIFSPYHKGHSATDIIRNTVNKKAEAIVLDTGDDNFAGLVARAVQWHFSKLRLPIPFIFRMHKGHPVLTDITGLFIDIA